MPHSRGGVHEGVTGEVKIMSHHTFQILLSYIIMRLTVMFNFLMWWM